MKATKYTTCLLACGLTALAPSVTKAAIAYGLTSSGLLRFDTSSPGTITNTAVFSGLTPGDSIADIDVRPQDGNLYGLAQTGTATGDDGAVSLDIHAASFLLPR